MSEASQFAVRDAENKKALIFLHGFGGDAYTTFGMMPAFVAGEVDLTDWDIHCFGYPTGLSPDITGVWAANPDLNDLSTYFAQRLCISYGHYDKLALVAHSMGGLIVQRALLDSDCTDLVGHVILFGTPSAGDWKARLARIFKRQVKDMAPDGKFITKLRADWNATYANTEDFTLDVVAGLDDQFISAGSSLNPFHERHHVRVRGNHVEIVKPTSRDSDSVDWVIRRLKGDGDHKLRPPGPPELPTDQPVDAKAIVAQALALELVGRQDEAIELLELNTHHNYYVVGALAGRYKRRWISNPDDHEAGQLALQLYQKGFEEASRDQLPKQAAYNGINAAFMQLALYDDDDHEEHRDKARELAKKAKGYAQKEPESKWYLATLAESNLHLGHYKKAIEAYHNAPASLDARERASMFQQAIWTARLLDKEIVATQLEALMLAGS